MSWIIQEDGLSLLRIVWNDEEGQGMTLGESGPCDPAVAEINNKVMATDPEKDARGFYWDRQKSAREALRLVKAVDKAYKAKQAAVCPCCKRPLDP